MSKEQPLFGVDVHPEYQRALNFERARAEGQEFCIIKATEGPYRDGDRYVPTGFKEYFRRAEAEGFVMGVYAFLLSTPAEAQADHFLRTIESVGGPEDKILMVDFERYNPPHAYLTPGNETLHDFILSLRRRVGDHPIVLYSGRGFWNGGDSSGPFEQYGADVAWDAMYLDMTPHPRPRDYYASVREEGWGKPWGGVEPEFWQFTSAGGVAGMNVDVNAYTGTREELIALTGEKGYGVTGDGVTGDAGDGVAEVRGAGGRRVLSHGVVDGTHFALGYKYVMQLNDRMKYWVWSSGPVPDGEGAYAVNRPLPPADQLKGKRIFCLTGDTKVCANDVERSYKRFYSGEVITVQTARGHKLTGTPNHPVLTDKGWLPLKLLRKGMNVVSSTSFGKRTRLKPDDDESPTSLEQIHRSVALAGNVERVVGTPFDFHGDGREGEIELVVAEGDLLGSDNSPLFEQSIEFGFPYTAIAGSGEPFPSTTLRSRLMGRADHVQPLSFGELAVLETLGFGVGAQHASFSESPLDDISGNPVLGSYLSSSRASKILADDGLHINIESVDGTPSGRGVFPMEPCVLLAETPVDEARADAEFSSDLSRGLAGKMRLDKIVSVDAAVFGGYVYNLQTSSGHYVANGLISHNCAGVPNLFRRAAGKSIPTRGNALYDGGVAAYFYTSAFGGLGPGFFSRVDVPFQLATAKKWARETGSGVLIGRCYRGNTLAGQGHVAILLPDGKVLQSFQFGPGGEPGLNTDYTIEQSHSGNYYEVMAHPKDWINHDKGQIRVVKPAAGAKVTSEEVEDQAPAKIREDGRDEEAYEPVEGFTDEEFREIGREIFELLSRMRHHRSRRRESETHE